MQIAVYTRQWKSKQVADKDEGNRYEQYRLELPSVTFSKPIFLAPLTKLGEQNELSVETSILTN